MSRATHPIQRVRRLTAPVRRFQSAVSAGRPEAGGATSQFTIDPDWAWARYEPDTGRPWTLPLAGHLYRRAAFGATWRQLQQSLAEGPQRTVDLLLRPTADVDAFNTSIDKYENAVAGSGGTEGLRAWWLRRMLETPHPLLEKMTLFWHSHFGISNSRVNNAQLMLQHVRILRTHALGRYQPMLEEVAADPSAFLGLGADSSRKAVPNDGFPRQLMEQLSLGPDQYGDEDLREAARAFTGWFVLRGKLRFFDREHDDGVKNILGEAGKWGAADVVRIVLEQPATPRLLVGKLYRWLISEADQPEEELLEPLVIALSKDYDVGRVIETMLRSNLFFSPDAYRRRVKCPVEYALGIVKGLEGTISTVHLGADLAQVGQNLYRPPTVKGWQGGEHWINAATVVGRSNLAQALLAPKGRYGGKLDPASVARRNQQNGPESSSKLLADLFLQGDVPETIREELRQVTSGGGSDDSQRLRELAYLITTLPEFQLC